MSAPARIPTPGDLARRAPTPAAQPPATPPAPATVADLVAPGVLRPNEIFRQQFQQGIRISRMLPESRLTALTLLTYANYRTGLLNKFAPSAEELSYATGLGKGQVLVQIEVLTQRGWLTHRTLGRGPRQGEAVLQLCIPALVLDQLRKRRT